MISRRTLSYGFSHHLLQQANELARRLPDFATVTPFYVAPTLVDLVARLAPRQAPRLRSRSHPSLPRSAVHTYPLELLHQLWAQIRRQPYSYFAAHDRMARRIVQDFAPPDTVIAIDTGAEALFRAWSGSTRRVLDLTIATPQYREKIFRDAAASHPDIAFHYPGEWELSRYAAEISLADLILCPSEFVMESCRFIGAPDAKLRLLPYGFDPGLFAPAVRRCSGPLRVGFAGSVCFRKGSHLLFPAFARLRARHPTAELHVYGRVLDRPASLPAGTILHGHVPQAELARAFAQMDVLAFPTLFEGSAYVTYQALASGLPVITTRNCGSVVDDTCGVLLPEITVDALTAALLRLAGDADLRARLAAGAVTRMRTYTWQDYGQRLAAILAEPFGN